MCLKGKSLQKIVEEKVPERLTKENEEEDEILQKNTWERKEKPTQQQKY